MKICQKCYLEKNEDEFGIDSQYVDGLSSCCKECAKKRNKYYKLKNKEKNKQYCQEYRNKNKIRLRAERSVRYYANRDDLLKKSKIYYEKRKNEISKQRFEKRKLEEERIKNRIRSKEWKKRNQSKASKISTEWKKNNPVKANCHATLFWAVRSGIIKRKEYCEECGVIGKVHGHHEDYAKPLEVKWLCKMCHSKKHRKYR